MPVNDSPVRLWTGPASTGSPLNQKILPRALDSFVNRLAHPWAGIKSTLWGVRDR